MLNEGWRRFNRGTDVVVGALHTHSRPHTIAQLRDLEVVGSKKVVNGVLFEVVMDLDALLLRRARVILVDELEQYNPPGHPHQRRWQDVERLLQEGMTVITTLDITHLESLKDVVESITDVAQIATVPDAFVRTADQIELVDMTPEALLRRFAHGNIYPSGKVDPVASSYFKPEVLAGLRELSLYWLADRVDEYLKARLSPEDVPRHWETRERIVVAMTGAPSTEELIRRGARMASRTKGELIGVHVHRVDGLRVDYEDCPATFHKELLSALGGTYHEITGEDIGKALVAFGQSHRATRIVIGASRRSRLFELLHGSIISTVVHGAGPIDVHVISNQRDQLDKVDGSPSNSIKKLGKSLSSKLSTHNWPMLRTTRRMGWLAALIGLVLLWAWMSRAGSTASVQTGLIAYGLVVAMVAAVSGFVTAMVAAVAASALAEWRPMLPFLTRVPSAPAETGSSHASVLVFMVSAGVVAWLVTLFAKKSASYARSRLEAESLARMSAALVGEPDPIPLLLDQLRTTFSLEGASLLSPSDSGFNVLATAGSKPPLNPSQASDTILLPTGSIVALSGEDLDASDQQLLQAFCAQLGVAADRRRLQAVADKASSLAEADKVRTALLAAVSHDLRTPLASIKASTTSLLQEEVDWSIEERRIFLETIDAETDRLNRLVSNLLDMSRLQTGSCNVQLREVDLEDVVYQAIQSIGTTSVNIQLQLPPDLPPLLLDPALAERAIANAVSNACGWAPPASVVRLGAELLVDRVVLRVSDSGPGIPAHQRDDVFKPFQRFGDTPGRNGVGLGLAVTKGFIEAMGGSVHIEETPGGGCTVAMHLPSVAPHSEEATAVTALYEQNNHQQLTTALSNSSLSNSSLSNSSNSDTNSS